MDANGWSCLSGVLKCSKFNRDDGCTAGNVLKHWIVHFKMGSVGWFSEILFQ